MGRKLGFTREERIAVVKQATTGGRTVASLANEYAVHENTVYKWIKQYNQDPDRAFTEEAAGNTDEIRRMQRRIRELEGEAAFLKKVHAYFAVSPRQNTR